MERMFNSFQATSNVQSVKNAQSTTVIVTEVDHLADSIIGWYFSTYMVDFF